MEFNKGDVIIVVNDFSYDGKDFYVGDVGSIINVDPDFGWCDIAWERAIGGHDLNGQCEEGHGWTVGPEEMDENVDLKNLIGVVEWDSSNMDEFFASI